MKQPSDSFGEGGRKRKKFNWTCSFPFPPSPSFERTSNSVIFVKEELSSPPETPLFSSVQMLTLHLVNAAYPGNHIGSSKTAV